MTDERDEATMRAWVAAIERGGPIRTVVDVGAASGRTCRTWLAHFPEATVWGYEPGPAYYELVALEQAEPRFRAVPQALGASAGTVTLHRHAFAETDSLLPDAPGAARWATEELLATQGQLYVERVTLEAEAWRRGWPRIDLLKIDVQGAELEVLAGAGEWLRPAMIRGIMAEMLWVPLYQGQAWGADVIRRLADRGYKLYGMTGWSTRPEHGAQWCDAQFIGQEEVT